MLVVELSYSIQAVQGATTNPFCQVDQGLVNSYYEPFNAAPFVKTFLATASQPTFSNTSPKTTALDIFLCGIQSTRYRYRCPAGRGR